MAKVFKQTDRNPIGMVVSSLLTLAQFQAINGSGWVLADGSSVAGSTYASVTGNSTIPDLRGMVLRGKNNGRSDGHQNPAGDVALGTFQDHAMQSHNHYIETWYNINPSNPGNTMQGYGATHFGAQVFTNGVNGANSDTESRMVNVTVNHFIKINN
jgi:hypothetical protein